MPQRCLGAAASALRAGVMALALIAPAVATAQTIALVPNSGPNGARDYPALFHPDAPWQEAARHVQLLAVPVGGVPDDQLKQMFAELRRRKIGVALDMLPLTGSGSENPNHCGFHVEGYSAAGETAAIAHRVKALGGEPAVYGMDEPLIYGHYYNGPNACHSSIAEIARDVAVKVRQVRAVFPGVKIGEAEPLMGLPEATWLADLTQWFDAFHAETGTPLDTFWLDLDWEAPWQRRLPALTELLRAKGIRLGVIYNGDDRVTTDEAWVASAVAHFQAFETALGHSPDAVSFQTWVSHPTRVLPESDPLTLTGLLLRYLDWKASRH